MCQLSTAVAVWSIQLLEEVCALGSDQSNVCQKTSSKVEQQFSSTQSNNNSASSDDDDEDDDVASTHSGTTLKQSTPSFADSQSVMPSYIIVTDSLCYGCTQQFTKDRLLYNVNGRLQPTMSQEQFKQKNISSFFKW